MKTLYLFLLLFFPVFCSPKKESSLTLSELRYEYLVDPNGKSEAIPRFNWQFSSTDNNKMQSAFRILVLTKREILNKPEGEIWDSGKVRSNQSSNVSFKGIPLKSFKKYFWKIIVWDEENNITGWSRIGHFETAMLNEKDWIARWIGDGKATPGRDEDFYEKIPAPLLRKEFEVPDQIKTARFYVAGLGYYETYLNGKKVGDHVLDPGWTNYGKKILYETYDITDQIRPGKNSIGVMLGNGWYNPLPLGLLRKFNLRKYLTVGNPKLIARSVLNTIMEKL